MNDQTQFENYLREFEPRKLRALSASPRPAGSNWRRLAAAATVLTACSLAAWLARQGSPSAVPGSNSPDLASLESVPKQFGSGQSSLIVLTRLAVQESSDFDVLLNEQSRKALNRFDQASSALRVLARE